MNVLFITHEGIDSSIFNSQVLTHARTLKNDGINIDILSFNTNEKSKLLSINNFNKLLKQDLDIKIILKFGVNIYLPFSSLLNGVLLVLFFIQNKEKYSLIHCRSDYTSFLGILTKFIHKKRIIWDCRGDSYNELKDTLSKKGYLIKLIGNLFLKPINLMEIFISSTYSDASIFVSKALYRSHSNILKTKNWKIIPCLVSEDFFFLTTN